MNWFELTIILAFVASALVLSLRHYGARINPFLLMFLVSGSASFLFFAYNTLKGTPLLLSNDMVRLSFFAGFSVFVLDLCFIFMFRYGASVSLSMPIYRVISVILSACVGISLFKESLSPLKIMGIVVACIAIYLLNYKTKDVNHV
jgi:multidrug transporter EmrE-like cation transporter